MFDEGGRLKLTVAERVLQTRVMVERMKLLTFVKVRLSNFAELFAELFTLLYYAFITLVRALLSRQMTREDSEGRVIFLSHVRSSFGHSQAFL